jgi:hypothetical protein
MNQVDGTARHEQVERTAGFGQMVVGVRQNADFHESPIVATGTPKASCFWIHHRGAAV